MNPDLHVWEIIVVGVLIALPLASHSVRTILAETFKHPTSTSVIVRGDKERSHTDRCMGAKPEPLNRQTCSACGETLTRTNTVIDKLGRIWHAPHPYRTELMHKR